MSAKRPNKAKQVRFGTGGLYSPPFAIVEQARDEFFAAVRRECPAALRDLRDRVLPVYRSWFDGADRATKTGPTARNLALLTRAAPRVGEAVVQWCSRWHLEGVVEQEPPEADDQSDDDVGYGQEDWDRVVQARAQWPALWALATLAAWSDPASSRKMLASNPPEIPKATFWSIEAGEPLLRVEFLVRPWSGVEDVETFRKEFLKTAERWFRTYVKNRRRDFRSYMRLAPRKHSFEHFAWLALYQVCGQTDFDISGRPGCKVDDLTTIMKGIHAAAELIGLVVRKQRARRHSGSVVRTRKEK